MIRLILVAGSLTLVSCSSDMQFQPGDHLLRSDLAIDSNPYARVRLADTYTSSDLLCAVVKGVLYCMDVEDEFDEGQTLFESRFAVRDAETGEIIRDVNKIQESHESYLCFVTEEGALYCLGRERSVFPRKQEVRIATQILDGVLDASFGRDFICAIDYDKVVSCRGQNHFGQLGVGREHSNSGRSFLELTFPEGFLPHRIYANGRSACAMSSQGQIACWGANPLGTFKTRLGKPAVLWNPEILLRQNKPILADQLFLFEQHLWIKTKTTKEVLCKGPRSRYFCMDDPGASEWKRVPLDIKEVRLEATQVFYLDSKSNVFVAGGGTQSAAIARIPRILKTQVKRFVRLLGHLCYEKHDGQFDCGHLYNSRAQAEGSKGATCSAQNPESCGPPNLGGSSRPRFANNTFDKGSSQWFEEWFDRFPDFGIDQNDVSKMLEWLDQKAKDAAR